MVCVLEQDRLPPTRGYRLIMCRVEVGEIGQGIGQEFEGRVWFKGDGVDGSGRWGEDGVAIEDDVPVV